MKVKCYKIVLLMFFISAHVDSAEYWTGNLASYQRLGVTGQKRLAVLLSMGSTYTIVLNHYGKDSKHTASAALSMAKLLVQQKKPVEAKPYAQMSIEVFAQEKHRLRNFKQLAEATEILQLSND